MRSMLRKSLSVIIFTGFISSITFGCGNMSDSYREYKYNGTNIGYIMCVEKNKNKGLNDYVVETICKRKHIQHINPPHEARGGYKWNYGMCSYGGWLDNKSDNRIITSFAILLKHDDNKDKSGKPIEERIDIDGLWIEPLQGGEFSAFVKYTPDQGRLIVEDKSLYSWSIVGIKGINVSLE